MALRTSREGDVVLAVIDRPEVHNALNDEVLHGLIDCVDEAAGSGVRCLVVTGEGFKAFCAGADLKQLRAMSADAAREAIGLGQRAFDRVARSPVPVITAVNGLALGGGFELVLASTFPIIAEGAVLGLPEASLGLIPGYGGTQRLTHAVGPQIASHVMLTGARLDAERAHTLGITPLPPVSPPDLVPTALAIAQVIATQGPRAVRAIRTATAAAMDAPLAGGLEIEAGLAALAIAGTESGEGIAAFLERREPAFERI